MIIDGNILYPTEGKWLCNGHTASLKVILAVNDSPSNWYEITEEEADTILNPDIDEEPTAEEIINILTGESND